MSEVSAAGTPAAASTGASDTSGDNNTTNMVDQGNDAENKGIDTSKMTASQKEKIKLLIDGEESEEEVDWNDRESLKNKIQLAAAAKKRMAQAKEQTHKAMSIIKELESDPENVLRKLGPKGREIAEKYLLSQIKDDMLTDEQKELRDLRLERQRNQEREAKEKETVETSERQKKEYDIAQGYQATIIDALNKTGLPKTPKLVARTAEIFKHNIQHGLELSPEMLAKEVKSERLAELKAIINDADGPQLIEMFGEEMAKKIRRHDIMKLKERQSSVYQQQIRKEQGDQNSGRDKPEWESMDDWKEKARQRAKV